MSTNFALTACPCAKFFRVNGDISLKSAKLTYLSTFLTSNGNTNETCGAPLYQWPDATNDAPTTKRSFCRPPPARRRTSHARSPALSGLAPSPTMPETCTASPSGPFGLCTAPCAPAHIGPKFARRPASRRRLHSPAQRVGRGAHPPHTQRVDGPSRRPHPPPTRKVDPRTASRWIPTN